MAVTRSVVLRNGVTVGYWVLQMLHIDYTTMIATANFAGYVDLAAYQSGKLKVLESNVTGDVTGVAAVTTMQTRLETAFNAKVDVES